MKAWEELSIVVKPFFATPYPGSEWYHTYKERILAQYGGDMDAFLMDLGDATKVTGNICENFDPVELYGLRELMMLFDYRRIAEFEAKWKLRRPEPLDTSKSESVSKRHELKVLAQDPSLTAPVARR